MADVEVLAADVADGRVRSLRVRIKNASERTIDRDTALRWLSDGHSLITYAGHGHHGVRGYALQKVEVGEDAFIRTDTTPESTDHVAFPHGH
ncbi:MAG: hypothetical protein ACOZNI_37095 [Myxococcota bacterium]